MQITMLFRSWRFISVRLGRSHGSLLQCDFYVYTCGQVQAHQSVDGFIRWIDDVHETLMSTHLELVARPVRDRSEEHTSELQSLMRISYAVFCLKKKTYDRYNK